MNTIEIKTNLKKAIMLLSDYTQTDDQEEKDAFLSLLSTYIDRIEDPQSRVAYYKVCDSMVDDKDLYIEILQTRLYDLESEINGEE